MSNSNGSALTRVLFWGLFRSLLRNSGNKHQNNPLVSAETVRHSSTYIILYLLLVGQFIEKVIKNLISEMHLKMSLKSQPFINELNLYLKHVGHSWRHESGTHPLCRVIGTLLKTWAPSQYTDRLSRYNDSNYKGRRSWDRIMFILGRHQVP